MYTLTNMISITVVAMALYAGNARADVLEWYQQQLFEPTGQQLAMEQRGRVMIYDGLHLSLIHI